MISLYGTDADYVVHVDIAVLGDLSLSFSALMMVWKDFSVVRIFSNRGFRDTKIML